MVIGGPPLAVLTLRWPRRTTLVISQAVFAAGVAVGLLTDDFTVLLVTRFLIGLAYAGFWAVAAVTAISLVTPDRTARASGVVVSGLSIAMVAGGPAGAFLSHFTGWQGGFWAVVALTVLSAVATIVAVPATKAAQEPSVKRELRTMRQPQLWVVYAATLLSTAAYMISYNYLAAFLTDVTGVDSVWVAGHPRPLRRRGLHRPLHRRPDRRRAPAPRPAHRGRMESWSAPSCSRSSPTTRWRSSPWCCSWASAGFVLNPAVYGRVFTVASGAPTLAGATAVSMFQLGISVVPVLAGVALGAGAGLTSIPWLGAGLAVLTIPVVLVERTMARNRAARDAAPANATSPTVTGGAPAVADN